MNRISNVKRELKKEKKKKGFSDSFVVFAFIHKISEFINHKSWSAIDPFAFVQPNRPPDESHFDGKFALIVFFTD